MFQKDDLFFRALEKCVGELYVIEEKTHNLVYTSSAIPSLSTNSNIDKRCYAVLHSRESACPFCPKALGLTEPEFVDGYSADSYVSSEKKWFQYKMLSYTAQDKTYRIVVKYEAESMMGLNREAIQQLTSYQNLYIKDAKIKKQLSYAATHDGMTGLFNKGKYIYDISRKSGTSEPIGIIVCDINNLKQMNDTFGHMVGDNIIRTIADVLKSIEEEDKSCYRIGGDEFVILQKSGNEVSLEKLVSEIYEKIERHHNITLSLAIGWAVCQPEESFESAFHRADSQMYLCKLEMKKECLSD